MVRFYKTYLGRMLLGLLILIELEKTEGKQGVAARLGGIDMTDTEAQVVANQLDLYINNYPDESPDNTLVFQGAIGQLSKRKDSDGDLLDTIVNVLRLPWGNYFSSGAIKALRDAILTPNELTDLRKSFKTVSKCACGHEFQSAEMATINVANDTILITCTHCARPSYIRCDYCDEMVLISSKVAATMRNEVDCGCRKRKEATNNVAAPTIAQVQAAQHAAEMRILRRQARGAGNVIFANREANAPRATPVAPQAVTTAQFTLNEAPAMVNRIIMEDAALDADGGF